MSVLLAQEFEIVWREIDDQEPSSRTEHARSLGDDAGAVIKKMQDLMDDDDVERVAGQGQIINVAMPDAAMFQSAAIEPGAGECQHVERQIKAKTALDIGPKQFKHAPGAGAEIKERADRLVGERGADRVLDRGVGDMQPADAIPLRGVAAEIGLRRGGARGAHRCKPLAVAGNDRIIRIESADKQARQIGCAVSLAKAKEGPG